MADPQGWRDRRYREGDNENFGTSMGAIGAGHTASDSVEKLAEFLRDSRPKGDAFKTLFDSMRDALPTLHQLVEWQQWDDLATQVEQMLETLRGSAENAGVIGDLKLTGQLEELLLTLSGAASAAARQAE